MPQKNRDSTNHLCKTPNQASKAAQRPALEADQQQTKWSKFPTLLHQGHAPLVLESPTARQALETKAAKTTLRFSAILQVTARISFQSTARKSWMRTSSKEADLISWRALIKKRCQRHHLQPCLSACKLPAREAALPKPMFNDKPSSRHFHGEFSTQPCEFSLAKGRRDEKPKICQRKLRLNGSELHSGWWLNQSIRKKMRKSNWIISPPFGVK